MEHSTPLSHRTTVFTLSASRLFERGGYYGLRSLLIIYMMGDAIGGGNFSPEDAIKIYGVFTAALVATQLMGGVLGDLLIGNKTSMIVGVFLQALGAFILGVPSSITLFAGLGLILLGGGLYSPNMLALFGKQYGDRKSLTDSGFMLFYIAVNIGAFIGVLLLSKLGENLGFSVGFIVSGIFFLIAGVLAVLSKDDKEIHDQNLGISITTRTLNVLILIAAVGLFWWVYELSGYRTREILVLFLVWSKMHTSIYSKVAVGFLFVAFAFLFIYLFPPVTNSFHILLLGGIVLLLTLAELFIAPTVYSAIAKYVSPKYMAIAMSLTFFPGLIIQGLRGLLGSIIYEKQTLILLLCMGITFLFGIGMIVLHLVVKKPNIQN